MFARSLICRLVNGAWIAGGRREHARFTKALEDVPGTQERYLLGLLQRNSQTQFGTQYDFAEIRSIAEYQHKVPVTKYDELQAHIAAIAAGEQNVLTCDSVTRFHPTSGSSGATKLIPWTAPLQREFQCAISPWIHALYGRKPGLLRGTSYWSISPPVSGSRTAGQLLVGFDHDSEYLGFLGSTLFSLVSTGPRHLAAGMDPGEFRKQTLLALLADSRLALISVWSPTFLTTLLDDCLARWDEIIEALPQRAARPRVDFLRSLAGARPGPEFFAAIWPSLQVISCWTHGPSELYAANLRRYFPEVEIQGKGLIATEAFVSLPFFENRDPVLAVASHFFEFEEVTSGRMCLPHEVSVDGIYRVIVTTAGGLYRYNLGDIVSVTGFAGSAPCLRFLGRDGVASDLCGEKLQGVFVNQAVSETLRQHGVATRFWLLAPTQEDGATPAYALFVCSNALPDAEILTQALEAELSKNFHYALCRRLRQLGKLRIFLIEDDTTSAAFAFQQEMMSRGVKVGDIKPVPLDNRTGWERRFNGRFV